MEQTVVITGADEPMGARTATAFDATGAHVVLGGRDRSALEAHARSLDTGTVLRADERDEFDQERLMEVASRAGGGIDVVVPAATIRHGDAGTATLPETSYSAYDDTLRANARGAFAAIREAVPHLNEGARIVVPVVDQADRTGAGPFAVADAARRAIVEGFASDLPVAVGGVAVPDPTTEADQATAADLIVRASEHPDLDGTILAAGALED
ncbi:MAG: SDR family oxidoreductase [Halanaeroarchaeum sp.]